MQFYASGKCNCTESDRWNFLISTKKVLTFFYFKLIGSKVFIILKVC